MAINFMIVAHVDHGKSTLSSKILSYCSTTNVGIEELDNLQVEKNRGITVRSTYVSFIYNDKTYNLLDTPGHVDFKHQLKLLFNYMSCAVILIDIKQGIQCQTIHNYNEILNAKLPFIVAVSKLDTIDHELALENKLNIAEYFNIDVSEIIDINYTQSDTIPNLLTAVSNLVSLTYKSRTQETVILDLARDKQKGWSFLLFTNENIQIGDTWYLTNQLAIKILDIYRYGEKRNISDSDIKEDIFHIQTNCRGDIDARYLYLHKTKPGKKIPEVMIPNTVLWSMLYPHETDIYKLKSAANVLHQNDYTFTYRFLTTDIIGHGLLCGFHGNLHKEVIIDRLKDEFGISCLTTPPLIEYQVLYSNKKTYETVLVPSDLESNNIKNIKEPFIYFILTLPNTYIDRVCSIIKNCRGHILSQGILSYHTVYIKGYCPLFFAVNGLDDEFMKQTNGYVSITYENIFYEISDIKPLTFKAHQTPLKTCDIFIHKDEATNHALNTLYKIKEKIDREQFEYNITASWGNTIIRSFKIPQYRKDTLVKVTGLSRVKKVLKRQQDGKKRLKAQGVVNIDSRKVLKWFTKKS